MRWRAEEQENHIAAGYVSLQRFSGAGRPRPPVHASSTAASIFAELAVGVGAALQLRADLGQAGGQVPVLEWRAIA